MSMKYATGKRVKVAEFDEGEHVSVEIPKAIQHPTDHVSCLKSLQAAVLRTN